MNRGIQATIALAVNDTYQCHDGDPEDFTLGGAKIPLVRCPGENEGYHLSAGVRFPFYVIL